MKFINRLKKLYKKYERVLIPGVLIIGVAADFITFRTISIKSAFIILALYWLAAGISIAFIQHKKHFGLNEEKTFIKYYKVLAPLIIQFTFGATLSASFIFYWFSGTLSISWPFMLTIAFLMVANEAFREHYMRPPVQLSVYYFITFSLLSLMLPYIFKSISVYIFILSGALSLIIFIPFLYFLTKRFKNIRRKSKTLFASVIAIFATMNALYFTNLIPPIPLSLTEAGVYYNIVRKGSDYIITAEKEPFINKLIPGQKIDWHKNDPLFIYSAIFAPFNLNTTIVHKWQKFNSDNKKWETVDNLSFEIYGGKPGGYRGYSVKYQLSEGLWRVNIQTMRGQVIGRIKFRIKETSDPLKKVQIIK